MDLRSEIRRIIREDISPLGDPLGEPLENPLDKEGDPVDNSSMNIKDKITDIKDQAKKEQDRLKVAMNAKRKAMMVPRSGVPEIVRQQRQTDNIEIKDLADQLKAKQTTDAQMDALSTTVDGMSGSLSSLEREKEALQAKLAAFGEEEPDQEDI